MASAIAGSFWVAAARRQRLEASGEFTVS